MPVATGFNSVYGGFTSGGKFPPMMGGRGDRPRQRRRDEAQKVFVGQLPRDLDSAAMRAIFEKRGIEVEDGYIIRDPRTKKSRGYAFLKLADAADVDKVMANRPYSVGDKEVVVKRVLFAENRPENTVTSERLFVGGLKDGHTEEALRDYFAQFGDVVSVSIAKDKDGNPRKFATVTFSDYDGVDKAVATRGHELNGGKFGVRKFLSQEDRNKVDRKRAAEQRNQFDPFGPMGAAALMGMMGGQGGPMMGGGGDWGYGSYAETVPGAAQGRGGGRKGIPIGQQYQQFGYGGTHGLGGGGVVSGEAQQFAGALRRQDVSDAGIEALMRENLLNPGVLSQLTMSEFASLPLSVGDRKRVQLVLAGMQ